jgi:hypothetical protein
VSVDVGKLAEMQQKAIDRAGQDIDVNNMKQGKQVKITDSSISDLASEL